MRVLGVDPGTRKLGWGVVERQGTKILHVAHGTMRLGDGPLPGRLVRIDEELIGIIATHAPTAAACETIFFSKNAQSAAKLGHARGVIILGLCRAGLEVGEYAPSKVKRAVVGKGRAQKHQVALVVSAMLGLREPPQEDAADALAVAITHVHAARFASALARQVHR